MSFEKILEYQKVDSELFALERKMGNSTERKDAAELEHEVRAASASLGALSAEADEIIKNGTSLEDALAVAERQVADLAAACANAADLTEIEFYERKIAESVDTLNRLENEIKKVDGRIYAIKDSAERLGKQGIQLMEKRNEAIRRFNALKEKVQLEGLPIYKKLQELAKDIPEKQMELYMKRRKDKKLPAFVVFEETQHCFCGMNLPYSSLDKLKDDGSYIECPNCSRIIVRRGK